MPANPPTRVCLFGLSADPPTGDGGHAGIVRWAATALKTDEVWVLPVFQHAFSEKQHMTPYSHRLAMAKLAFEHLAGLEGRVFVKETEREVSLSLPAPSEGFVGTLDVVKHLQARHPQIQFSLLMGGDTYADYLQGKWKGGRELELLLPICAVPRLGSVGQGNLTVPGPHLSQVSSRALRASTDEALWAREVAPAVREYVRRNRLYDYGRA